MKLKKKTGGSSVGGYTWENDGDVVEVEDTLGDELIAIDPEEYTHVPDDAEVAEPAPEPAAEFHEGEPETEHVDEAQEPAEEPAPEPEPEKAPTSRGRRK